MWTVKVVKLWVFLCNLATFFSHSPRYEWAMMTCPRKMVVGYNFHATNSENDCYFILVLDILVLDDEAILNGPLQYCRQLLQLSANTAGMEEKRRYEFPLMRCLSD